MKVLLSQVTYNTLIDVYGKLGRWEDALQVLQRMKAQVRLLDMTLHTARSSSAVLTGLPAPSLCFGHCRAVPVDNLCGAQREM